MNPDIIIRSFIAAVIFSLIAVILEAAYYGLRTANYSIASPFASTFINNPLNYAIIALIFISSFVITFNTISKSERT
ncbi:hypothetical protein MSSAC_1881 [Methanosarcina siciliae C2J]|uniref:Uncharacterized protein n=3 Tax=Methanosarcina siciliae TaxID=38027 RepID=A0A0E3PFP3_9EURY|nr:hypothetical protein [Methanosarcina siciliae]AKB29515.1 hypothetical protein MSSIT_2796 [Methanosarcina siciliae T4/M]AKB33452.1 hypothetical protein MSSIH_2762 [Methanosarcina siciliae HI350]AKB36471.1 hypothetical protein MSSAC_1881 [Methanosarcina siciliae C2J]